MWQEQTREQLCNQEHKAGDQVLLFEGSMIEEQGTVYQSVQSADGPWFYKVEVEGIRRSEDYFGEMLDKIGENNG